MNIIYFFKSIKYLRDLKARVKTAPAELKNFIVADFKENTICRISDEAFKVYLLVRINHWDYRRTNLSRYDGFGYKRGGNY